MKILGIETATIVCGTAVVIDGVVTSEKRLQKKNAHAESILQLIDATMVQAKVRLPDLDAVAVSIGPGSFTGLRIGLSVAKGLCFSMDKPLVAVPTLSALAQRAYDSAGVRSGFIVSAMDARRDEVYCQIFRVTDHGIEADDVVRDMTVAGLTDAIKGKDVTITGDAISKLKRDGRLVSTMFVSEENAQCDAATVALIGERMASGGTFVDARTCEPAYIKEFFINIPN